MLRRWIELLAKKARSPVAVDGRGQCFFRAPTNFLINVASLNTPVTILGITFDKIFRLHRTYSTNFNWIKKKISFHSQNILTKILVCFISIFVCLPETILGYRVANESGGHAVNLYWKPFTVKSVAIMSRVHKLNHHFFFNLGGEQQSH